MGPGRALWVVVVAPRVNELRQPLGLGLRLRVAVVAPWDLGCQFLGRLFRLPCMPRRGVARVLGRRRQGRRWCHLVSRCRRLGSSTGLRRRPTLLPDSHSIGLGRCRRGIRRLNLSMWAM